jgi:hypothetical protein
MSTLSQTGVTAQHDRKTVTWSLVSAVNNEAVLRSCLLGSPEIHSASEVILQRGYASAATAYNAAINQAGRDVVVLIHQDVYLPTGWTAQLQRALVCLNRTDPQWAVAGVWGGRKHGKFTGHLYCAGLQRVLGRASEEIAEVSSLDEVLLIVRKSSGVRFDERLAGFHLYGTDICLEAKARGLKSYAISAFCIHNTNGYGLLPLDFWKAYLFLRRKWNTELPIATSCTEITASGWPAIHWNLDRAFNLLLRRHRKGHRVADPKALYDELVRSGELAGLSSPSGDLMVRADRAQAASRSLR